MYDETGGFVSWRMLLLNLLHFVYVVDFFINEDWCVRCRSCSVAVSRASQVSPHHRHRARPLRLLPRVG
jgi:hypothetical protein